MGNFERNEREKERTSSMPATESDYEYQDSQPTPGQNRYRSSPNTSITSVEKLLVSEAERVNVLSQNVDQIYNEEIDTSSHLQHLQALFHECTRSDYIYRLIAEASSGKLNLENLRDLIFKTVKACSDYPFQQTCVLKRRRAKRNGDTLEHRLAEDVYILVSVLDGGPFEDVKCLMSDPKLLNTQPASQNSQGCDHDVYLMKQALAEFQSDLLLLKEENINLENGIKSELKSMKSEIASVKKETSSQCAELHSIIVSVKQACERVLDERSSGAVSVKHELKLIQSELTSATEALDQHMVRSQQEMANLDKKVSRLEHKMRSSNKDFHPVAAPAPSQQLRPLPDTNKQRQDKAYGESVVTPQSIIRNSSPDAANQRRDSNSVENHRLVVTTTPDLYSTAVSRQPNKHVTTESTRPDSIPVIITRPTASRAAPAPQIQSSISRDLPEEDFSLYVRKRNKRYFVGGFLQTVTENLIYSYAKKKGVQLSTVTIYKPKRMETAVIRVNAQPDIGDSMLNGDFWPPGVTCSEWVNKADRDRQSRFRFGTGRHHSHNDNIEHNFGSFERARVLTHNNVSQDNRRYKYDHNAGYNNEYDVHQHIYTDDRF